MQPPARPGIRDQPVEDVGERHDLALVAGFLGQFPEDGGPGGLAELESATRQRPDLAGRHRRRDATEQDPPGLIHGERIGRDPGPLAVRHGASSVVRKRGSSARLAGTRSPMTRPIVARTAGREAMRRAA